MLAAWAVGYIFQLCSNAAFKLTPVDSLPMYIVTENQIYFLGEIAYKLIVPFAKIRRFCVLVQQIPNLQLGS